MAQILSGGVFYFEPPCTGSQPAGAPVWSLWCEGFVDQVGFKLGVKEWGIIIVFVKVKPMATLCREVVDAACDLGEYCDGVSQYCPSDAYIADGTDCQTDKVCV